MQSVAPSLSVDQQGSASGSPKTRIHPSKCALLRINENERGKIHITLETKRLRLETIDRLCQQTLTNLYGDERVMRFYGNGKVRAPEFAADRIKTWEERAHRGDPFHGLLISKADDGTHLGVVVLGYSEVPGVAELARVIFQEHWNRGYGSEVAQAITQSLAPALRAEGYTLQGVPLSEIMTTSHPDNIASQKSLLRGGFKKSDEVDRFGAPRNRYSYAMENEINTCLDKSQAPLKI